MSASAQYASIPRLEPVIFGTANTARDGSGTMATLLRASSTAQSGTRIDKIQVNALGDTTNGMLRLFLARVRIGLALASLTFVTTTATATTSSPHGLVTGDLVTVEGAAPSQYNVTGVAITVLTPTSFSYAMGAPPATNATVVGSYVTSPAGRPPVLWRELPVSAAVVSPRTISSIGQSSTTATLTTATPHGLSTGDTVVIAGATPAAFNGTFSITVTTATAFTYQMLTAPGSNATVVGAYSAVKLSFSGSMSSTAAADTGYLPLILPVGTALLIATNNAEQFAASTGVAGDFA